MTIDELMSRHTGDTIVLQGDTPEAYAIRRQEAALVRELLYHIRTEGGLNYANRI